MSDTLLLMKRIVETVREPLVVLDKSQTVRFVNDAFSNMFKLDRSETVGHRFDELGNREWDIDELRTMLDRILDREGSFDDYEMNLEFASIGAKRMLLNARLIKTPKDQSSLILLAIEEIE